MSQMSRAPKRFPVDMPAKFRVADSDGDWIEGRLLNLSESGLCLQAEAELLLPGETLEILIHSVDKKGMIRKRLMRAKVVWRKEGRAGVQFMRSGVLPQAKSRKALGTPDRGQPKLSIAKKPRKD